MIKIELQFETGAEARQALQDLLGAPTFIVKGPDITRQAEQISIKLSENAEEKPAEESASTTKKRQTKAEKEAAQTEKLAEDIQEKEQPKEAEQPAKTSAVTKEMLQEKAVSIIRANPANKEKVVAIVKSFGADSVAQADKNPLKAEDYAAVMDEFNKI